MCETTWEAPEEVYTLFEDEGYSLWEFCDDARQYEEFNVDDFCADDSPFSYVCGEDGYPDFALVCDADFPPGTFEGTNFLSLCEVDYEDACAEFPELCGDDGSISSDLCGIYPEMCDMTSPDYNPCAANLYDCIMSEDFDLCWEFPELCGYSTDFDIPDLFEPAKVKANMYLSNTEEDIYTCNAQIWAKFGEVEALIDALNYFYDANITAGATAEF